MLLVARVASQSGRHPTPQLYRSVLCLQSWSTPRGLSFGPLTALLMEQYTTARLLWCPDDTWHFRHVASTDHEYALGVPLLYRKTKIVAVDPAFLPQDGSWSVNRLIEFRAQVFRHPRLAHQHKKLWKIGRQSRSFASDSCGITCLGSL